MSIIPVTAMDVDSPAGTLKRCSSAPMINDINTTMTTSPTSTSLRDNMSFNIFASNNQPPRTRRFSASCSPLSGSPTTGPRLTPRISQIRQEECVDLCNLREVAHERDTHSAMQISQSWEDLTLVTESLTCKTDQELKPPRDSTKTTPLHVSLSPYASACSSPSPTRAPGLVGSPSFQNTFKTLSPSPTRKYPHPAYLTRRSASPVLRPSQLGQVTGSIKRKLDDEKTDSLPKTKKMNNYSERGGLLMAHSSQSTMSSPLPGSLSSVGTPESLSSADSPGFTFRPVDSPSPNRPAQNHGDEPMIEESSLKADHNMDANHHHGPS